MKTIEQRVKDALGEQTFQIIALAHQLEEAQAKIAELEKKVSVQPAPPSAEGELLAR